MKWRDWFDLYGTLDGLGVSRVALFQVPGARGAARRRSCDELCQPRVRKGPAGKQLGAVGIPVCQKRLIAAVRSSLGLQVGGINAGESQLLFPSLGFEAECGLAWLSGMTLTHGSRPPDDLFQNAVSYSAPCGQSHVSHSVLVPAPNSSQCFPAYLF